MISIDEMPNDGPQSTLDGLQDLQNDDKIQKGQETLFEDFLRQRAMQLIAVSKEYLGKVNSAKTKTKKAFYKKKLVKNNEEIARYLLAIEKINMKNPRSIENGKSEDSITKESSQNNPAA